MSTSENDLKATLQAALMAARKERDRLRTLVLSTFLSEVRNREIEEKGPLSTPQLHALLAKAVKQREDSAHQMREAQRPELAEKEEAEGAILQEFLPPPLTDEDVRALVEAAVADGAADMGAIMGRLMPQIRGRFDGGAANRIVREVLGA
ncbi:MAG: GatB/YqeY domain-containing protein [Gemmatimonadota bacterium]